MAKSEQRKALESTFSTHGLKPSDVADRLLNETLDILSAIQVITKECLPKSRELKPAKSDEAADAAMEALNRLKAMARRGAAAPAIEALCQVAETKLLECKPLL